MTEILLGRDAGWRAQRRGDRGVARQEIYRKLAVPTLCGIAMAASAYAISVPLLLWMSPVIVGLVLAIQSELSRRCRRGWDGYLRRPKTIFHPQSWSGRVSLPRPPQSRWRTCEKILNF